GSAHEAVSDHSDVQSLGHGVTFPRLSRKTVGAQMRANGGHPQAAVTGWILPVPARLGNTRRGEMCRVLRPRHAREVAPQLWKRHAAVAAKAAGYSAGIAGTGCSMPGSPGTISSSSERM